MKILNIVIPQVYIHLNVLTLYMIRLCLLSHLLMFQACLYCKQYGPKTDIRLLPVSSEFIGFAIDIRHKMQMTLSGEICIM